VLPRTRDYAWLRMATLTVHVACVGGAVGAHRTVVVMVTAQGAGCSDVDLGVESMGRIRL
jgi:hypothetical protein